MIEIRVINIAAPRIVDFRLVAFPAMGVLLNMVVLVASIISDFALEVGARHACV